MNRRLMAFLLAFALPVVAFSQIFGGGVRFLGKGTNNNIVVSAGGSKLRDGGPASSGSGDFEAWTNSNPVPFKKAVSMPLGAYISGCKYSVQTDAYDNLGPAIYGVTLAGVTSQVVRLTPGTGEAMFWVPVVPRESNTLSVGTAALPFADIYATEVHAGAGSIYIGGAKLSFSNGVIQANAPLATSNSVAYLTSPDTNGYVNAATATNIALSVSGAGIVYYLGGNTASDVSGWRLLTSTYSAASGAVHSITTTGADLTNGAYIAKFCTATNVTVPPIPPGGITVHVTLNTTDGAPNSVIKAKAEMYVLSMAGVEESEIDDTTAVTLTEGGVDTGTEFDVVATSRQDFTGKRLGIKIKITDSTLSGTDTVIVKSEGTTFSRLDVPVNAANFVLPSDLGAAAYSNSTAFALAAAGVSNGNSHDHAGGDGAQIAHSGLSGITGSGALHVDATSTQNWQTAYSERLRWDGGSTGLTPATGRTSLGLGNASTSNVGTAAADVAAGNRGVTNGDSHDHSGGDGSQIAHSGLSGITGAGAVHVTTANTNVLAKPLRYRKATYCTRWTAPRVWTNTISFAAGELTSNSVVYVSMMCVSSNTAMLDGYVYVDGIQAGYSIFNMSDSTDWLVEQVQNNKYSVVVTDGTLAGIHTGYHLISNISGDFLAGDGLSPISSLSTWTGAWDMKISGSVTNSAGGNPLGMLRVLVEVVP